MYIRLCSLGFGVTLLIFQNSKKNSPKIKIKKIKKNKNKKLGNTKSKETQDVYTYFDFFF